MLSVFLFVLLLIFTFVKIRYLLVLYGMSSSIKILVSIANWI